MVASRPIWLSDEQLAARGLTVAESADDLAYRVFRAAASCAPVAPFADTRVKHDAERETAAAAMDRLAASSWRALVRRGGVGVGYARTTDVSYVGIHLDGEPAGPAHARKAVSLTLYLGHARLWAESCWQPEALRPGTLRLLARMDAAAFGLLLIGLDHCQTTRVDSACLAWHMRLARQDQEATDARIDPTGLVGTGGATFR